MVASRIADVPGASAVLQGGVVAYQVSVKRDVLGVDAGLLERHGPVHPEVAEQMAVGAARACGARIGVSTTGVAGPEPHGGHATGTVYIGWAVLNEAGSEIQAQGHELLQLEGTAQRCGTRPWMSCWRKVNVSSLLPDNFLMIRPFGNKQGLNLVTLNVRSSFEQFTRVVHASTPRKRFKNSSDG
ncbi:CinA family protein [Pseudoglutamicibacter albus]|uniref:CinA family protein n=1 Tax=Pseudoglutamicibacter albus TaxID=98671 RepID=UPI0036199E57